jgi:mono/diheme cytochrome c family protein
MPTSMRFTLYAGTTPYSGLVLLLIALSVMLVAGTISQAFAAGPVRVSGASPFASCTIGGGFGATVRGANLGATGCATCHGVGNTKALLKEVPTGHFQPSSDGPTDVSYCIQCHTLAQAAPAFTWAVHQSHFAQTPSFAGTCLSCHQLDASGNFTVIGVTNGLSLQTTQDVLTKLQPYYRSWATSALLDHTHGQQSITCVMCHGTPFPTQAPTKQQCLACHATYSQPVPVFHSVTG